MLFKFTISHCYNVAGFDEWSSEGWGDFDDSLRLQREINHLRQEVTRLRADSQHWRSVAGQLVSVHFMHVSFVFLDTHATWFELHVARCWL